MTNHREQKLVAGSRTFIDISAVRRARPLFALLAAVSLSGCGTEYDLASSELGLAQTVDGDPVYPSLYQRCKNVTISGNVYYNDLRESGRFSTRWSPTNVRGTRRSFGAGSNLNYLGLRDATVEIYEVDKNDNAAGGCVPSRLQGSTTVASDGSFSWQGEMCDNCEADAEGGVNDTSFSVAAKVVLRQCDDDRCFRVAVASSAADTNHFADDWSGSTYSRWFRTASTTTPKVFSGLSTSLGTDYFQASASMTPGVPTDLEAQAANVFASMVDVTRKVHTELNVPFTQPEVSAYFPADWTHSHEGGFLCVKAPPGDWIAGDETAHEYGHLIHYSKWHNHGKWVSYCYDDNHDGDVSDTECDESYAQEEYVNAAFKEGWADFIAHVAFDQTGSSFGCDRIEYDAPRGCTAGNLCAKGRHYFSDVSQVLCDLWDNTSTVDMEDLGDTNVLDRSEISLPTLVAGLHDMWHDASDYQREEYENSNVNRDTTVALGICEYAEALISSQISPTGLDATLNVTNLECGNL